MFSLPEIHVFAARPANTKPKPNQSFWDSFDFHYQWSTLFTRKNAAALTKFSTCRFGGYLRAALIRSGAYLKLPTCE